MDMTSICRRPQPIIIICNMQFNVPAGMSYLTPLGLPLTSLMSHIQLPSSQALPPGFSEVLPPRDPVHGTLRYSHYSQFTHSSFLTCHLSLSVTCIVHDSRLTARLCSRQSAVHPALTLQTVTVDSPHIGLWRGPASYLRCFFTLCN